MSHTPLVLRTPREMQADSQKARQQGLVIGLVPTMGALHPGHMSLVDYTRRRCDRLVVSIFVNPIQFNNPDDLAAYPRTWEQDIELCARAGVDVIYAPTPEVMYPEGFQTTVSLKRVTRGMEGDHRPGHFDGVSTVVLKLFNVVQPNLAAFGEKDYQQLRVVQCMVQDLDLPVEVVGLPTVREDGGLAMSSRNRHLSHQERQQALCLYRGLSRARDLAQAGERQAAALVEAARAEIQQESAVRLEYLEVFDAQSLEPVSRLEGPARMALAAQVGRTRLIDNLALNY